MRKHTNTVLNKYSRWKLPINPSKDKPLLWYDDTCVNTYSYIRIVYMCAFIHMYTYVYIYVCMCVCVNIKKEGKKEKTPF